MVRLVKPELTESERAVLVEQTVKDVLLKGGDMYKVLLIPLEKIKENIPVLFLILSKHHIDSSSYHSILNRIHALLYS